MSEQKPPTLRAVELVCPKCKGLITRRDLDFIKFDDDTWHAQAAGNCVRCAQKMEFHLKVDADGCVYAPIPGKVSGELSWTLFGHMSFVTGEIIAVS